MPTPQQEAAFHEAGHCYIAVGEHNKIASFMMIEEAGPDEWGGDAYIVHDHLQSPAWTSIAVAGAIAEARSWAIEEDAANNTLAFTADVVNQLFTYVEAVWADEDARRLAQHERELAGLKPLPEAELPPHTTEPAIQLNFWIAVRDVTVEGTISRNDVLMMSPLYRSRGQLRRSIICVLGYCNNPDKWAKIQSLVDAVIAHPNHKIERNEIEDIVL